MTSVGVIERTNVGIQKKKKIIFSNFPADALVIVKFWYSMKQRRVQFWTEFGRVIALFNHFVITISFQKKGSDFGPKILPVH